MTPNLHAPSLTSLVARAVSALMPVGQVRRLARRRVMRWCRRQGFELLRWRVAKPFEGPSSWSDDQRHYRIQIIDADGQRRGGYVTFARQIVFERCIEVLWDDASGRRVPGSPDAPDIRDDDPSGLVPIASLPR